jgi:glucose dehydrogenase
MGGKDQQPSAYSPRTGLFYVPTNNMCMNYEGLEVKYTAGAPYVGANVLMFQAVAAIWVNWSPGMRRQANKCGD